MPCAFPNSKNFQRQTSSVQRTSSIPNDHVNERSATSWINGMEMHCAIPTKGCGLENLMRSHSQKGGEYHDSMAWQSEGNVRTNKQQLLLNLHDITSIVLTLVRTEAEQLQLQPCPVAVYAIIFLSAT